MLVYIGLILLFLGLYYSNTNPIQIKTKPIKKKNRGLIKNIKINVKNLDSILHDYSIDDMRKFYLDMDSYYQLNTKYDKISDMYSEMFNRSNISKTGLNINEAPPEIFYL